jgi:hypothetical protein
VGSVAYTGRKREGVDEGQVVDRLEIVNKTIESPELSAADLVQRRVGREVSRLTE